MFGLAKSNGNGTKTGNPMFIYKKDGNSKYDCRIKDNTFKKVVGWPGETTGMIMTMTIPLIKKLQCFPQSSFLLARCNNVKWSPTGFDRLLNDFIMLRYTKDLNTL